VKPHTDDVRVTVARDETEVQALREAWAALPWHGLDAQLDFFLQVIRTREEVLRPHVVLLERDGAPWGMLLARVEDRHMAARIGYAKVLDPVVRTITVVDGGISGPPAAQERLIAELRAALRRREARAAFLHKVRMDSTLHEEIVERWPRTLRDPFSRPECHRARELEGSFDDFLASLPNKLRGNVRREGRKLRERHGDALTIRTLREPADLPTILGDIEDIARRTYQRGLGGGFDAAGEGPLIELGLQRGWYRAWVLYLEGRPIAFETGYVVDGTFFSASKGFDPDYGPQNVGTFVQMESFASLCADPDVRAYDFGYGDADYKRRCATTAWEDVDLALFAPGPLGLGRVAARGAVHAMDRAARRALGDGARAARLKRAWRARRTPQAA
jgi:CelD/BcsL family acetyltransferase involved in cellulose biosynthesis